MSLPWLVLYLFHEELADNVDEFLEILKGTECAYERVGKYEPARKLLDKAVNGVREGEIETDEKYSLPAKPRHDQIEELYVEPVGFFNWVEKEQGTELSNLLIKTIEEHKISIRPFNFREHQLSFDQFHILAKKDLWNLHTAILYIKGFKGCSCLATDRLCIQNNKDLHEIYCDAVNSYTVKNLSLLERPTHGEEPPVKWGVCYSVKPKDIIEWARKTGVDSPILKEEDRRNKAGGAAETKCRKWLMELMKDSSSPEKTKPDYLEEAQHKVPELSERAFLRAWEGCIEKTGNTSWSKPGRRSKQNS